MVAVLAVVPVLALGDVTGALLRPLALGYVLASSPRSLVALTVTPALALLLLAGAVALRRSRRWPARWDMRTPPRCGGWSAAPAGVAAAAGVLVLAGLAVLPALRHQPVAPALQDRDLLISWKGAPGTSLPEMTRITGRASRELRAIPGVRSVGAHVGRAITVRPDRRRQTPASCGSASTPAADYGATIAAIAVGGRGLPRPARATC